MTMKKLFLFIAVAALSANAVSAQVVRPATRQNVAPTVPAGTATQQPHATTPNTLQAPAQRTRRMASPMSQPGQPPIGTQPIASPQQQQTTPASPADHIN